MADELVTIFRSPLGINTVDDPSSERFQPPSKQRPEQPFLTEANNLDLLRTGDFRRRPGRTKLRTLTKGHSGTVKAGGLYYADDGALKRFVRGGDDITITTGLSGDHDISYAEAAGEIFWANGVETGRIRDDTGLPWGLRAAEPPALSAGTGGLRAGRYLVAVTPRHETLEGGCRQAGQITLASDGGIVVAPVGIDPNADWLNVYCSDTNGDELFYVRTAPVGSFTIGQGERTTQPCQSIGVYPPPPGHLVRWWNGRMLVATSGAAYGNAIYFSEPLGYHRFRVATDLQLFPSRVVLIEPLSDGFFVGLESGVTLWLAGNDPSKLQRVQVDNRMVSEGEAVRVPASKLPWIGWQSETLVPVWATQDGWAAGLPGGIVKHAVDGRVAMPANRKATLAYAERPGLRQIMLSMRDQRATSAMGFGDQATVTVTRGGIPI